MISNLPRAGGRGPRRRRDLGLRCRPRRRARGGRSAGTRCCSAGWGLPGADRIRPRPPLFPARTPGRRARPSCRTAEPPCRTAREARCPV